MEAAELRIGNLIAYNPNGKPKYKTVIELLGNQLICGIEGQRLALYYDSPYLEPIPLTPEILEKIGFVDGEFEDFEWSEGLKCLVWQVWDGVHLPHIQYVHQFQNFYFAALNKELQITL